MGAENFCSNFSSPGRRAHLVSVLDRAENDFIRQYAETVKEYQDFWIGYSDTQTEGKFVSTDGGHDSEFTDWGAGEPNNFGGQQNCAYADKRKFWDDRECYFLYSFMCKMKIEEFGC